MSNVSNNSASIAAASPTSSASTPVWSNNIDAFCGVTVWLVATTLGIPIVVVIWGMTSGLPPLSTKLPGASFGAAVMSIALRPIDA